MDTADINSLLWHFGHQLPVDRQTSSIGLRESALAVLPASDVVLVSRALARLSPRLFRPADCG